MNWKQFWERQALAHEDPHEQVARVQNGQVASEEAVSAIALHIKDLLDLQPSDELLDLCCGNGMLSHRLAMYCKSVIGVDFSPSLLKVARTRFSAANLRYVEADARDLGFLDDHSLDKINLYFSFQYFDSYAQGEQVLQQLTRKLKPGGKIVLGDVPDLAKIRVFYTTIWKWMRYRLARIRGRDQMGRFWSQEEMEKMAQTNGLKIQKLSQASHLPFHHYRVDYLLEKPLS